MFVDFRPRAEQKPCYKNFVVYEIIAACDVCEREFVLPNKKRYREQEYNFCSMRCQNESQRTGVLKQKKCQVFDERYGGHPLQNKEVFEKFKATNLARCYGYENPLKNPEIKAKAAATNQERYGVSTPLVLPQNREKMLEAQLQNFENFTSKPEDELYSMLLDHFQSDDVVRQFWIPEKRWLIDFYISSIKTCVQLDGVYWHGTDRSFEKMRANSTAQGEAIKLTYEKDRQQDVWFRTSKFRLVRITDKELQQNGPSVISKLYQKPVCYLSCDD